MILFYRIITTFIYPILVLIIFFRKLTGKEDKIRFKEKVFIKNFNVKRNEKTNLVSCCKYRRIQKYTAIIEEINKDYKNIQFLVTTVTLSSANLANDELKNLIMLHIDFFL